ncbi:hypothetical protein IAT40_003434 [Kwoniella sp. CBS 6097]
MWRQFVNTKHAPPPPPPPPPSPPQTLPPNPKLNVKKVRFADEVEAVKRSVSIPARPPTPLRACTDRLTSAHTQETLGVALAFTTSLDDVTPLPSSFCSSSSSMPIIHRNQDINADTMDPYRATPSLKRTREEDLTMENNAPQESASSRTPTSQSSFDSSLVLTRPVPPTQSHPVHATFNPAPALESIAGPLGGKIHRSLPPIALPMDSPSHGSTLPTPPQTPRYPGGFLPIKPTPMNSLPRKPIPGPSISTSAQPVNPPMRVLPMTPIPPSAEPWHTLPDKSSWVPTGSSAPTLETGHPWSEPLDTLEQPFTLPGQASSFTMVPQWPSNFLTHPQLHVLPQPAGTVDPNQIASSKFSNSPPMPDSDPPSTSSQAVSTSCSVTRRVDPVAESSARILADSSFALSFQLVEIPGKGHGLIATRPFKRGELILKECPFLLLPLNRKDAHIALGDIRPIYEQLKHEAQRQFDSLYARKDEGSQNDPLVNIVETNSIPLYREIDIEDQSATQEFMGLGVFLTISRINHSCAPNAGWIWYYQENMMRVYAYTDIPAGAEISASYLEGGLLLHGRDMRRLKLRHDHGFDCICKACDQASALGEEIRAVDEIDTMAHLLRREGKWDLLGRAYSQLYQVYACHGMESEAKDAAQMALAAYTVTHGVEKAEESIFALQAQDPTQYINWTVLVTKPESEGEGTRRQTLQKGMTNPNDMKPLRGPCMARKTQGPLVISAINTRDPPHMSAFKTRGPLETSAIEEGATEEVYDEEEEIPTPSPPEEDVTQDKKRWKGGKGKGKKLRWDQDGPFSSPKSSMKKKKYKVA